MELNPISLSQLNQSSCQQEKLLSREIFCQTGQDSSLNSHSISGGFSSCLLAPFRFIGEGIAWVFRTLFCCFFGEKKLAVKDFRELIKFGDNMDKSLLSPKKEIDTFKDLRLQFRGLVKLYMEQKISAIVDGKKKEEKQGEFNQKFALFDKKDLTKEEVKEGMALISKAVTHFLAHANPFLKGDPFFKLVDERGFFKSLFCCCYGGKEVTVKDLRIGCWIRTEIDKNYAVKENKELVDQYKQFVSERHIQNGLISSAREHFAEGTSSVEEIEEKLNNFVATFNKKDLTLEEINDNHVSDILKKFEGKIVEMK